MIVLNFAHPLTDAHREQIEALSSQRVERVMDIPAQFDSNTPFAEQVEALVASVPLTPRQWQTEALLVNPPSYNFAAVTLLAHLEGRMGYLPSIIRLRPVADAAVRQFEVAEIIPLADVRAGTRKSRFQGWQALPHR